MFIRRLTQIIFLVLFALISTSTAGAAHPATTLDPSPSEATKGYEVTLTIVDILADNLEEDCCFWSSDNNEIHFTYAMSEGGSSKSTKPKGKVHAMLDSWAQVVENDDHIKRLAPIKIYVTYGNGLWVSFLLLETEDYSKAKKYSDKVHKWAGRVQNGAEVASLIDPSGISLEVAGAAEFIKWTAKASNLGTQLVGWLDGDDTLGNPKLYYSPSWLKEKAGKPVSFTSTFSGKNNGDKFLYKMEYQIKVIAK
jgi:hypothetical protein